MATSPKKKKARMDKECCLEEVNIKKEIDFDENFDRKDYDIEPNEESKLKQEYIEINIKAEEAFETKKDSDIDEVFELDKIADLKNDSDLKHDSDSQERLEMQKAIVEKSSEPGSSKTYKQPTPSAVSEKTVKRRAISLDTKIQILDCLQKGERMSTIARCYGMNESTIRTIKKNEIIIRKSVSSGSMTSSKVSSYVRDNVLQSMEKALIIWIEDSTQKRIPIDINAIKQKAVRIYNQIKQQTQFSSSDTALYENPNFCASKGWFEGFKKRQSLYNLKNRCDLASGDEYAANQFLPVFMNIIDENAFCPDQVFNADETKLYWKKLPSRKRCKSEKSPSGFKAAKERVTLLLCSNASGDRMMKPLLINRALKPRSMRGINMNNIPVHWMANKKAWMTTNIFTEWFHNCFIPEAESYLKEKDLPFKVLLLLGNAPSHPHDIQHPNVKVVFLPPNTTSLIQPLDQGIISTFKTHYIRRTLQDIWSKADENKSIAVLEICKRFTILNCAKHVALACNEIGKTTLNACWKPIWPQIVERDNIVPTRDEEFSDIINLSNSLLGDGCENINNHDIGELLADEELTEDDLVSMVLSPKVESGSAKPTVLTADNLSEVLELAKKLEKLVIDIDPNTERALKFQHDLKNIYSQYEEIHKVIAKKKKKKKAILKVPSEHESDIEPKILNAVKTQFNGFRI